MWTWSTWNGVGNVERFDDDSWREWGCGTSSKPAGLSKSWLTTHPGSSASMVLAGGGGTSWMGYSSTSVTLDPAARAAVSRSAPAARTALFATRSRFVNGRRFPLSAGRHPPGLERCRVRRATADDDYPGSHKADFAHPDTLEPWDERRQVDQHRRRGGSTLSGKRRCPALRRRPSRHHSLPAPTRRAPRSHLSLPGPSWATLGVATCTTKEDLFSTA